MEIEDKFFEDNYSNVNLNLGDEFIFSNEILKFEDYEDVYKENNNMQTKDIGSLSDMYMCQNGNNQNNKSTIFNIYKIPKLTKTKRVEKENIKSLLKQKKDRDEVDKIVKEKNYFIIDNKIYKTSDNLTQEEKKEIKKIQNRISAQKCRDEQKALLQNLQLSNKKYINQIEDLRKEIKDKDVKLQYYESIIYQCKSCKDKLNNSDTFIPYIIQTDEINSELSSHCTSKCFGIFGSSIAFFVLIFLLIMGITSTNTGATFIQRKLIELNYSKFQIIDKNIDKVDHSPQIYNKELAKRGIFLNNNIRLDYEYDIKYCPNKTLEEYEDKKCGEYFQAKISKELNFSNIYEENPKCFNFRMIIPCGIENKTNETKEVEPIIALENSPYYQNIISQFKTEPYYEMYCKIYQVNKIDKECDNNFK